MQVVVLATQKGGAGKTTLCGHLAVQAEICGNGPVALIDADSQGSLAAWWNEREAPTPVLAKISAGGLRDTLRQLESQGVQTVIVDTPGTADKSVAAIIRLADLVIVPVVPSPHDLRAIKQTIDMVDRLGVRMIFVVNNAGAGRLTGQAAVALSQHGTVAPQVCRTRQDFRASMIAGLTAMETDPKSKSGQEIAELWTYVVSQFERSNARGKASSS